MNLKSFVLFLAIGLSACSGSNQQPAPAPTASVKTATVNQGAINTVLTVYGDIAADASSRRDFVAPVEAQITRIAAPFGSLVRRGEPVVYLSPSPQSQLDLAQAATAATQANSALARARRLRSDGLMSDADVEAARANARAANAVLDSLRSRQYVLRAPAEGTITRVDYSVGDIVAPGTIIASLTLDGDVRARFGIDPSLARLVRRGDTISISPTSGGPAIATSIIAVDPVVDPVTRLASVFARISASAEIAPGEPLKGEITVNTNGNALRIPQIALLDDGGQKFVYTVLQGKAKRVDVTIGSTDGGLVEILTGLQQGDVVVTQGAAGVSDGIAVTTGSSGTPSATATPTPSGVAPAPATPATGPATQPTSSESPGQ